MLELNAVTLLGQQLTPVNNAVTFFLLLLTNLLLCHVDMSVASICLLHLLKHSSELPRNGKSPKSLSN